LLQGAPEAVALATAGGLTVLQAPDRDTILREMAAADIVQVHWWNNPELQSLLHAELPALRLLLWYHVAGQGAPQIITPELVHFADLNVPTNPWTYRELPAFRDLPPQTRGSVWPWSSTQPTSSASRASNCGRTRTSMSATSVPSTL